MKNMILKQKQLTRCYHMHMCKRESVSLYTLRYTCPYIYVLNPKAKL